MTSLQKPYLVTICEQYDGLEFYSKHIMMAYSVLQIMNLAEKELAYYGHEDSESIVRVDHYVPLTPEEYVTLRNLNF